MSSDTGGVSLNRKGNSKQIIFVVIPVIIILIATVPGVLSDKDKEKKDESETFSKSPTNHEKVLSKKKQTTPVAIEESSGDDYWVGSHKLEFKPHPLLMPSTQAPSVQIPIPLIEMGLPPTTPFPAILSIEDSEGASSDEQKQKVKQGKGRDRRKKGRYQRLMAHRTLWANATVNNAYLSAIQKHPQLVQQQRQPYYVQQPQQSVIITSAGATPVSNSLYLPSQTQASNNGNNFHGTSTTWNINHPGNNFPSYVSGQISSHENQNLVQSFPSSSIQQYPFGFPQLGQPQQFIQQFSQQSQTLPAHNQPLPISPSAPDTFADNIFMNSHQVSQHYLPQQQVSTGSGTNGGPVIVYIPSNGMMQSSSASGPIPMKTYSHFSPNDIPMDFSHKLPYPVTGPSSPAPNSLSNSKPTTNPQFLRNNFIRMFMDKLASVGKVLPIPFVTKYSSSQGFNNHHGHFHRRM